MIAHPRRSELLSSVTRRLRSASTPEAPFGVLCRAGTSRVLVFEQSDLPLVETERFLSAMLFGGTYISGLGEEHYQANKIAIFKQVGFDRFDFEFIQGSRSDRTLIHGLECSNSAAAVAVCASAGAPQSSCVEIVNVQTSRRYDMAISPVGTTGVNDVTLSVKMGPENLVDRYSATLLS